ESLARRATDCGRPNHIRRFGEGVRSAERGRRTLRAGSHRPIHQFPSRFLKVRKGCDLGTSAPGLARIEEIRCSEELSLLEKATLGEAGSLAHPHPNAGLRPMRADGKAHRNG